MPECSLRRKESRILLDFFAKAAVRRTYPWRGGLSARVTGTRDPVPNRTSPSDDRGEITMMSVADSRRRPEVAE
ncbi:hypothetical protein [Nocardia sp. NPDC004123]